METGRRFRIIRFSGCVLEEILRATPRPYGSLFRGVTSEGPDDLKLIRFHRQISETDEYEFIVESESFEIVPEGTAIPLWTPTFTSHYEERDADAA